jgi:thiamine kinase-like enzyme
MSTETEQARAALAGSGLYTDADISSAVITRLGGLTNKVYRVDMAGQTCCLRLPGEGTGEYINRDTEAHNARAAGRAGVSPEVLLADSDSGVMITAFLDGCETMTPALFARRDGAPARAGKALGQLHGSGETFRFTFELFAMIDEYLKLLADKAITFPAGYYDVLAEAQTVRAALQARPLPQVPSHCDPLCENFLDDGTRMWIVDWEYSGMNDPMWDLGDLSVEGGFSPEQDAQMLHAYFGGAPSPADQGRMVLYKAMCDLLWTLWGLIQHANNNPAEDFMAYAENRFARCRKLMAEPGFAAHLAAVHAG